MTTASITINSASTCVVVNSAFDARVPSNLLATFIYVAAPQIEEDTFTTSYIPTNTNPVTRTRDFSSITGPNFSSWYNPIEGTFGVEFQTLYSTKHTQRFILIGNGGVPL